jgi:peptide/nickel transport system permease protein
VWLAAGWIAVVLLAALLADVLPFPDALASDQVAGRSAPPSTGHWLGTDELGRDILARLAKGAQVSMTVGLVSVAVGMTIGGLVGMVAGYARGLVDRLLMAAVDVLLAFPALVLVILLVSSLQGSGTSTYGEALRNVTSAIAVLTVAPFARVTRAATISTADRDFVTAARAMGASTRRILATHVLPNAARPLATYAPLVAAVVVVAEGSLAFLSLSVPRPHPSWGSMIDGARPELLAGRSWSIAVPSVAMLLTVLSLNLLSDRLRARVSDVREAML